MRHALTCFAEYGYGVTTNRVIGERAGLTPSAVRHYFNRKRDLMFAVHDEVSERFLSRLGEAGRGGSTYPSRIRQLLLALHDIIVSDREVVAFGFVAREEARRFDELAGLNGGSDARFASLFSEVVDDATRAGQVDLRDESRLIGALSVVSLGLAAVALDMDTATHLRATDACARLFASFGNFTSDFTSDSDSTSDSDNLGRLV